MVAPVVLTVYRRPLHAKQVIEALKKNFLAAETDLYIFADAPKMTQDEKKNEELIQSVSEVRNLIKKIDGFRSVTIKEQEQNLGLANSVITSVTEIMNNYDKVIVLEDDFVSSPYFLTYMNKALAYYQDFKKVFSIDGYSYSPEKLKLPEDYIYDTYFVSRPATLGWGTWSDRWNKGIWEHNEIKELLKDYNVRLDLEKLGTDIVPMLLAQLSGEIDSCSVRWAFTCSYYQGVNLLPVNSYIDLIGLDGTGTNCSKDGDSILRVNLSFAKNEVTYPPTETVNKEIARQNAYLITDKMPLLLHTPQELQEKIIGIFKDGKTLSRKDEAKLISILSLLGYTKDEIDKLLYQDKLTNAHNRPIFLWGAGTVGKRVLQYLRSINYPIKGFIDNNPLKVGQELDNVKIYSFQNVVDTYEHESPFIIITTVHAPEIQIHLEEFGFKYYNDFVISIF
jgi:hypothetical protein